MSVMDTRLAVAVLASLIGGLLVVAPPAAGQAIAYKEPNGGNVKIARGIDGGTAGEIVDAGAANAVTLGRISDLDDDGTLEVPAILGNGNLVLIGSDGSTEDVRSSAAAGSRAALGVGDGPADAILDGEPEIIYRDERVSDGDPAYVPLSGNGNVIVDDNTEGIFGFGDYNDDEDKDVAYLNDATAAGDPATNNNIFYVDDGNRVDTGYPGDLDIATTVEGIGPLADFDFDGVPRAAVITEETVSGAVELALVDASGTAETFSASPATPDGGRPLPIGAADVVGDYKLEIIFVDDSNNLKALALDNNGTVTDITESDGTTPIKADPSVGVSGDHNTMELKIEGEAGNEGDPNDPASLGGDAGWRMIGPPVQSVAPADLKSISDPAGSVIEFDLVSGDHMFFEWDDSQGEWGAVTGDDTTKSKSFQNGRGYLLFLFDDEGTPNADPLDPTLPIEARRGDAIVPTDNVTVSNLSTSADFHLLANPYNQPINLLNGLHDGEDDTGPNFNDTSSDFSTQIQIWDGGDSRGESNATEGSYVTFDLTTNGGTMIDGSTAGGSDGNVASAWQAFFVERTGTSATQITFDSTDQTSGERDIVGDEKSRAPGREPARIGFKLTVENSDGTQVARDEAASLYFHPEATPGADGFDGSKLTPLTHPYATIGPVGPTAAGDTAMKSQESRPMDAESPLEVPFQMQTAGSIEGTARLRATQWYEVPSDWSLTLIDTKGTADPDDDVETALTRSGASGYTFEIDAQEKRAILGRHPTRLGGDAPRTQGTSPPRPHRPEALRLADAPESKTLSPADSIPRFTVRVSASGDRLPVELAAFDARVEDRRARLSWQTAGETNNAGFYVQHRPLPSDDETTTPAEWSSLGFVESRAPDGTTQEPQRYRYETGALEVGRHVFRLRQVDTDGSETLSDTTAVEVGLKSAAKVEVAPNPVRSEATSTLRVRSEQTVRIGLYDVLGRKVRTVHEGRLSPRRTHTFSLEADELPSGLYFLHVQGERFETTKRVTVVQ